MVFHLTVNDLHNYYVRAGEDGVTRSPEGTERAKGLMGAPIALVATAVRFYGIGPHRNFSSVLEVFNRTPYTGVLAGLAERGLALVDDTDINNDVAFWYRGDTVTVALSMVGPHAIVLEHPGSGQVSRTEIRASAATAARYLAECGFTLCDQELIGATVEVWNESLTVYELLFENDDVLPSGCYVPAPPFNGWV